MSDTVCGVSEFLSAKKNNFLMVAHVRMLVQKVVTFLKRMKMAILFFDFDQIRPKWIEHANLVNNHLKF